MENLMKLVTIEKKKENNVGTYHTIIQPKKDIDGCINLEAIFYTENYTTIYRVKVPINYELPINYVDKNFLIDSMDNNLLQHAFGNYCFKYNKSLQEVYFYSDNNESKRINIKEIDKILISDIFCPKLTLLTGEEVYTRLNFNEIIEKISDKVEFTVEHTNVNKFIFDKIITFKH